MGSESETPAVALRRRAEGIARGKAFRIPEDMESLSVEAARQMLHELRVHQIELGMQNEELRRAQAELDASRARYLDLYDLAPMGYCTLSEQGLILEANLTAATLLGVAKSALVKQPIFRFILPEDQDIYYQHRKQLFETHSASSEQAGEPQACELRLVKMDGTAFWVHLEAIAAQDAGGTPVGRTVLIDITARKRAEEKLRVSEENFRRSLDESPLGIRTVSKEGETLYANRATLDIFKYDSIEEWQTTQAVKRYTEQSYAEFKVRREKRCLGENDSSEYGIDIVRKDGTVRNLQVWRKRILWNGNEHYQVIYHDITERKRAEEKLQQTLESLRKAVGTTIQLMISAVETRDPYTAGHQVRSANLARAIATEMGLPQEKVDGIRMAGSIHDIGKLSIPAEILSKPTKLSEIEFSLIKEHARQGYEILKDVESPWPLAEIVYQHHERMDGSGYPRNLKGGEILMEARILTVADVVEAMASHRPYRAGLGIDAALEEIEKNRGTLYDEAVVNACLRVFREKGYRFAER
jgi:PAS domain S-box-containing protein/putative nucleotidyltransferase with HDIG domain